MYNNYMENLIKKIKNVFNKNKKKYKTVGIVAEFNPLHQGHIFLLNKAKEYSNNTIIALSPNIVQRGEFASFENSKRAVAAIDEGATLVVEIPHIFTVSSAEFYADGAVRVLKETGCEAIIFGSEIADIKVLENAVNSLESPEIKEKIYSEMKKGISYKVACSKVFDNDENLSNVFNFPNATLSIEYIKACKKYGLEYIVIQREGDYHEKNLNGIFSSATSLRNAIKNKEDFSKLPISKTFKESNFFDSNDSYFYALKYKANIEDIKGIYDIKEGIENLIKENLSLSITMDDFLDKTCNKRYSKSKILRICSHIFFDIKEDDAKYLKENIDYIRVLAIKKEAVKLLSNSNLFVTKYKDLLDKDLIKSKQFILQNKIDSAFYTFSNRCIEYKNMVIVE